MALNKIPDSELMAEKLGMIVLCENCGGRLKKVNVLRIYCWAHESNNSGWCNVASEIPYARWCNVVSEIPYARPREGLLAAQIGKGYDD